VTNKLRSYAVAHREVIPVAINCKKRENKMTIATETNYKTLSIEHKDGTDWLTLNRPDAFDAIDQVMTENCSTTLVSSTSIMLYG